MQNRRIRIHNPRLLMKRFRATVQIHIPVKPDHGIEFRVREWERVVIPDMEREFGVREDSRSASLTDLRWEALAVICSHQHVTVRFCEVGDGIDRGFRVVVHVLERVDFPGFVSNSSHDK
jgi:hypothetical protein